MSAAANANDVAPDGVTVSVVAPVEGWWWVFPNRYDPEKPRYMRVRVVGFAVTPDPTFGGSRIRALVPTNGGDLGFVEDEYGALVDGSYLWHDHESFCDCRWPDTDDSDWCLACGAERAA